MAMTPSQQPHPAVRLPLPEMPRLPVPPAGVDVDLFADLPVPPTDPPHPEDADLSPPAGRTALRFPPVTAVPLPPPWCDEKPDPVVPSKWVADRFERIDSRQVDDPHLLQPETADASVASNEQPVLFVGGDQLINPFREGMSVVFCDPLHGECGALATLVCTPPGDDRT